MCKMYRIFPNETLIFMMPVSCIGSVNSRRLSNRIKCTLRFGILILLLVSRHKCKGSEPKDKISIQEAAGHVLLFYLKLTTPIYIMVY